MAAPHTGIDAVAIVVDVVVAFCSLGQGFRFTLEHAGGLALAVSELVVKVALFWSHRSLRSCLCRQQHDGTRGTDSSNQYRL